MTSMHRNTRIPPEASELTNSLNDKHSTVTPDASFLLLPLPEFQMLPFGGFLDKLRFSADDNDDSRQHYCTWKTIGLTTDSVVSSSGVAIEIYATPAQIRLFEYDYLVVFGSRTARRNLELAPAYAGLLRQAANLGVTLVCIDNACFLLAACGLLADHKVVVHWRHTAEFRTAFPRIEIRTDQIYCFDKTRISCAGGSAAIDLAVELLALRCGRSRALKGLADMLVDDVRSQLHVPKSVNEEAGTVRHVGRAISLMRNLLADKTTTDEIAALIGIGRRQLDRLFKENLRSTAHEYWTEMRLQHIRWRLLNSNLNLTSLAEEIGIQDASYLCKIFCRRFGENPEAMRKNLLPDITIEKRIP